MPPFNPGIDERFALDVGTDTLRFQTTEHPGAPGIVHALEGAKGIVFRVRHLERSGAEYALKLMRRRFREPELERVCIRLDGLKNTPGLAVCDRQVLSPTSAPSALAQYPDLAFAILMPWIRGYTWGELRHLVRHGYINLTSANCLRLSEAFASVVMTLERQHLAHCDLSPANLISDFGMSRVELIDVEDMYGPRFAKPSGVPLGTPGYQHRMSHQGQWHANADRFAAAILFAEMLTWHSPRIWAVAQQESLFAPDELQQPGSRTLSLALEVLREQGPWLAGLFERAWRSTTFAECPSISEWKSAMTSMLIATPLPGDTPRARRRPSAPQGQVEWKEINPAAVASPDDITWAKLPRQRRTPTETQVSWDGNEPPKRGST